jgi:hypothetical protein
VTHAGSLLAYYSVGGLSRTLGRADLSIAAIGHGGLTFYVAAPHV